MNHPQKGRRGLDRLVHATGYSLAGLAQALREESAFRQEFVVAMVALPASLWLGRNWLEVTALAGSVLLVMIVELLNTGIESAIDRVSFDQHPLSKRAKDMGSAAVLLSLLLCAGVWLAACANRWRLLG